MFWGLTPALDFLAEYSKENPLGPELNVLIIGGSDGRHILQTIAHLYRYQKIKVNFFVMELSMEVIARQLLLLNVALQKPQLIGFNRRIKAFMELYGNTLVRPSVARYLTALGKALVRMVTNFGYLAKAMPFLTIDIKYKERDYLENVLKFWCGADSFDVTDSWDRRLRKFLGVRYDSKVGVFDWDLHMRLHSVGASQICSQEYRNFRTNGVAFAWLESEVSKPNRSLVCATVPNGDSFVHCGYLGDMQTGPFIAFGLHCEHSGFLESQNGVNSYRATDVTERNLAQVFHEIHFGEKYKHEPGVDGRLGPVTMVTNQVIVDSTALLCTEKVSDCIELENVTITVLSMSAFGAMMHKEKYKGFFDLVYFASPYLQYFNPELLEIVSRLNGLLIVENKKFQVGLRDKNLQDYGQELKKIVENTVFAEISFDPCKDNYARFKKHN